jgi:hypothetical protein
VAICLGSACEWSVPSSPFCREASFLTSICLYAFHCASISHLIAHSSLLSFSTFRPSPFSYSPCQLTRRELYTIFLHPSLTANLY